jgi:hypothetical protein
MINNAPLYEMTDKEFRRLRDGRGNRWPVLFIGSPLPAVSDRQDRPNSSGVKKFGVTESVLMRAHLRCRMEKTWILWFSRS